MPDTDEQLIRDAFQRYAGTATADRLPASGAGVRLAAGGGGRRPSLPLPVLRRRTIAVLATVFAAGVAAFAVVNAVSPRPAPPAGSHLPPLVDTAATPAGWAPVAFENLQLSVPASWTVNEEGCVSVGEGRPAAEGGGWVFAGALPDLVPGMACGYPPNVVSMIVAGAVPLPDARPATVNGMAVVLGRQGDVLLARAAGVDVTARGPLAAAILRTLTVSPLSVVLGSSVSGTPAGWRDVAFGGLRFTVPGGWAVSRVPWWGGCPSFVTPDVLTLSSALEITHPPCLAAPGTAGSAAGVPALVVGAGPQISRDSLATTRCLERAGLRICLVLPVGQSAPSSMGRALSLLDFLVYLPGQQRPDEIELGLFGSGLTSLQIFDSLRPAGT